MMISQEDILTQLKAQPKRTAVMCLLLVVLVIVVVRAFHKPETASAAVHPLRPAESAVAVAKTPTVEKDGPSKKFDPADIEMILEKNPAEPVFPRRNIFAVNLNYFPEQYIADGKASPRDKALDPQQSQVNFLQEQAMGFHLQSTLTGPVPTAYIDGVLVRERDRYKGFTIRKIQNGKVILDAKGHLFSLTLSEK